LAQLVKSCGQYGQVTLFEIAWFAVAENCEELRCGI